MKDTRTLYEISDDLKALVTLLEEEGGDVSDTEEAFESWFKELGAERNQKLENYAYLIQSLEADAKALKEEIDRLKDRKTTKENKAKRLRERLEYHFKAHEIERIETEKFTFAMQKPGGKPKVVLSDFYADNPVELAEGLRRVKFEADLEAIRERLESGDPGMIGVAMLQESDKKLRIK